MVKPLSSNTSLIPFHVIEDLAYDVYYRWGYYFNNSLNFELVVKDNFHVHVPLRPEVT